jgi:hypothetical protein
MANRVLTAVVLSGFLIATPVLLQAQGASIADSTSSIESHLMGPWKEMNAFHRLLGETWHAASKDNLVPLRARARDLKVAADAWAASKVPESPASCASEQVRTAITKVAKETRGIVAMITAGADDTWLAASLKGVHDSFESVESKCGR